MDIGALPGKLKRQCRHTISEQNSPCMAKHGIYVIKYSAQLATGTPALQCQCWGRLRAFEPISCTRHLQVGCILIKQTAQRRIEILLKTGACTYVHRG